MRKRSPALQPEWDLLFPLLIQKWRKLVDLPKGPEDRLQTREFQRMVEDLRSYQETGDLSTKSAVGAFLLYHWPMRYAEGLSLMKEIPQTPTRVLEIGGTGSPFSFAAMQHGAIEALSIDQNELALKQGAELFGHFGYPLSIRTGDLRKIRALPIEGKWDLICLPHSLFSLLETMDGRLNYIKRLLDLLTETGHLLVVESSSTEINREFLLLRDLVAKEGLPIAAPCLWKGSCPALRKENTPCYAQRPLEKPFLLKEIQRACNINLSSLKMSYLLLPSPLAQSPSRDPSWYRVVSPPVETFRGTRFFLCGVAGKKTLGSQLTSHPKHSRAFEYLKRGDVLSIEDASSVENDLQITEDTKVSLVAPCDKPLP